MSTEVRESSAKYLAQKSLQPAAIGELPHDWTLVRLTEVADVRGGVAKNANVAMSDPIDVAYLRVANVQDGYLDLDDVSKIKINKVDLKRYSLLPGDVLMNEGGDLDKLGRGALWRGEIETCVHQNHVFSVRCKPQLLGDYLNVWTGSASARRFFLLAGKQTTNLASISKSSLGEMPVFLPRLEEQLAIATALSDVDALIAGLEKLIAKKRDLKQAAMQQLLTGQTRLPGFSGDWEPRQLGQLGPFLKGSGVKRDEAMSGDLPCVRYGEIYTVHSDVVRTFHSRISPQVAAIATRIQKGDLLFAGSGETKAEIGKCVAMALPMEAYAGGDIVILRLRSGSPSFFGYLLNTTAVVRQKSNLGQGDAVVHISALALSNIEVEVPSIEEQTAIATVLFDMDLALSALKDRLAKTCELKQGMMQVLLTGRTRLV